MFREGEADAESQASKLELSALHSDFKANWKPGAASQGVLIKRAPDGARSLCTAPHQCPFQGKIVRDKHVNFGLGFYA